MGDCELLVGAYPDYKIHVHSNTPNLVLEHMLQLGQIYEVFIHNMEMEAHDRTAKIHEDQEKAADPAKALALVAVAAGSGEADILKSLGVDVVVSGGQTMNPSTADLLGAVDQVNATSVIILPNNGNIRMAAEAAASACTDKKVAVVPTKTVPQAFSALFAVLPIPSSRTPSPPWSTPSARFAMARSPAPCATPAHLMARRFTPVTSWVSSPAPSTWSAPT